MSEDTVQINGVPVKEEYVPEGPQSVEDTAQKLVGMLEAEDRDEEAQRELDINGLGEMPSYDDEPEDDYEPPRAAQEQPQQPQPQPQQPDPQLAQAVQQLAHADQALRQEAAMLQQYIQQTDWKLLEEVAPGEAANRAQLVQAKQQELMQRGHMLQQGSRQVQQYQLASEHQKVAQAVPDWGPELQREVAGYLRSKGFTDHDISSVTDSRAVILAYNSMMQERRAQRGPVRLKVARRQSPPPREPAIQWDDPQPHSLDAAADAMQRQLDAERPRKTSPRRAHWERRGNSETAKVAQRLIDRGFV